MKFSGDSFIVSHEAQLWIRESNGYPQSYQIRLISILDDETVVLYCDTTQLTLYLGDVLLFDNVLVVIKETFTFIWAKAIFGVDPRYDGNNPDRLYPQNTTVKILPLTDNIPVGTIADTYALTPVYSLFSHSVNQDGTTVTRNDKNLGIWTKSFVTSKKCDIPCNGFMIRNDIGFHLLYEIGQGSKFIFFELRYNPYIENNIGTARANASVSITDNSNPLEFVDVNFSLKIKGTPELYTPLKLGDRPFYCPLNYPFFYKSTYKLRPVFGTTSYCPLDTTGFYI